MSLQKKSLSFYILSALEKTVDGVVRFDDLIHKPGYYAYKGGWDYPLDKSALAKAIARLKEKGMIEQDGVDTRNVILKLTDEGRTQILLSDLEMREWDNKWRVVIFDIPEQKRLIRDLFRRNLKKWGFKPMQKSVWVSKKNVTDKLFNYIKELGVEKWVWVFESEKYGPLDIT